MSYTKKSTTGSQDPRELRLPGVFITKESFWTRRSRITNFQEHTTISKGSVILKTDCRLLMFEKMPNLVILINSQVYFARESEMNTNNSVLRLFLGKIHQVGKTPLWWILWGVLTPELFVTRKLFCKPVLVLVRSTQRSRLTGVFITGKLSSPMYSLMGSWDSPVYSLLGRPQNILKNTKLLLGMPTGPWEVVWWKLRRQ
jgi:hypothetical protein